MPIRGARAEKHFQYPLLNKIEEKIYKERIKRLEGDNARKMCKYKVLSKMVLCWFLLFLVAIPVAARLLFEGVTRWYFVVGIVAAVLVLGVGNLALAAGLWRKIYKKYHSDSIPLLKKEELSKLTLPLRRFYQIGDSYVVTKCFEATDAELIDKDVLVFGYGNGFRIVCDLFSSRKDFGCYEFRFDETTVRNETTDGKTKTVISCDTFRLTLGYRAGTYLTHYRKIREEKQ